MLTLQLFKSLKIKAIFEIIKHGFSQRNNYILITYFIGDVNIQVNLLRVIFVAMKFTTEEQQKVKDGFNANNTSYLK